MFGNDLQFVIPIPASFASNEKGWTTLEAQSEGIDTLKTFKQRKFSAGGALMWGAFRLGGSGASESQELNTKTKTDKFSIKMEYAAVKLFRPWLNMPILRSRMWRFDPSTEFGGLNGAAPPKKISDGGAEPQGELIAVPITAIFIRNVEIGHSAFEEDTSELSKIVDGKAGGGWGFGVINLGGKYNNKGEEKTVKSRRADGKLRIEGMQLIGYHCELLGLSPNPFSTLTSFV